MIMRGSYRGQTRHYLPGDPDPSRREICNYMVGPFAGCARVKGTFRNPELAVVFMPLH